MFAACVSCNSCSLVKAAENSEVTLLVKTLFPQGSQGSGFTNPLRTLTNPYFAQAFGWFALLMCIDWKVQLSNVQKAKHHAQDQPLQNIKGIHFSEKYENKNDAT